MLVIFVRMLMFKLMLRSANADVDVFVGADVGKVCIPSIFREMCNCCSCLYCLVMKNELCYQH